MKNQKKERLDEEAAGGGDLDKAFVFAARFTLSDIRSVDVDCCEGAGGVIGVTVGYVMPSGYGESKRFEGSEAERFLDWWNARRKEPGNRSEHNF